MTALTKVFCKKMYGRNNKVIVLPRYGGRKAGFHLTVHKNLFEINYIIAREQKRDENGASFQS